MKSVKVDLQDRSYSIKVGTGLLDQVGPLLREAVGDEPHQTVVVSNKTVNALFGGRVMPSLRRAGFVVRTMLMGDGERHKSLRTAESIYNSLIDQRVGRKDVIIALGGGVVGDVAGFVAATYLRGIGLVQIPTTLLAQLDSSVGGKTGVNHPRGKNLIGAFHQPRLVVADPATLRTLPAREMNAGLYEAVKYGVISDGALFHRIEDRLELLKDHDARELTRLIARSCEIKADIVARDEREQGLRRILNFGHTVGHALEAATGYRRFHHGEAVGHGMRVAAGIAERLGLLAPRDRSAIDTLVARVGKLPHARNIAFDDIISVMRHDKKAEAGKLTFVLPVEVGRVVIENVPPRIVRLALNDFLLPRRTGL